MQAPGKPAHSHPWKCFVRAICSRQRFIALLGSTEPPQKNFTETTAIYILWKGYCWFCRVLDYVGFWLWEGHYKFLSCVKTKDETWQCLLQSPNCSYHALVLLAHCLHRAWAGLYWMHKTLLDIDGLHRPCTGNWQYITEVVKTFSVSLTLDPADQARLGSHVTVSPDVATVTIQDTDSRESIHEVTLARIAVTMNILRIYFQMWWLDLCNDHTVKMRVLEHLVCVWQLLCHLTQSHWTVCSLWEWVQNLALQVCLLNCFCWHDCQQWRNQAMEGTKPLNHISENYYVMCRSNLRGHTFLGNSYIL